MPDLEQRPKILTGFHDPATLHHKVEQHEWTSTIYTEILESVRPYVERHADDPEWIVSRLCMHWQTRNSRTFVNGARWSHSEGNASVPTVRFAGARDWATDYASPAIEDLLPYSEDTRGIWLQNKAKPGNHWEWADVSVTGHVIEGINERIMDLAEKAAFLFWYLDDEDYAKFAADILVTYCQGMHHRSPPETFEDHSQAHILGLATFEVIHERITTSLAVAYEFLVPYLHQKDIDTELIQNLFRSWADRIIEGGFAHGNWNLHQAKYIVPLGLVLESNEAYEDSRGREYYVSHFISQSTPNQACLADLVRQYDKKGVWPESPGYAFNVTDAIIHISQLVFNGIGQDPVANYPVLEQAALLVYQFCFPNGRTVGFGDTNHNLPNTDTLELMIARARRLGESRTEERLTAVLQTQIDEHEYQRGHNGSIFELANYVDHLLPSKTIDGALSTRTFLAETVSLVLQRNGCDPHTGLMASLTATKGGHSHAGSLALELYGCGLTISPDSGPGISYWQKEHSEYYARPPAHNTVVVDGISTYDPHNHDHPFTINTVEPKPQSQFALSDDNSFFDVSFHEPSTDSDQRRIVGLVRTSATSGYYVDIFRSRRRDGADRYHDYIHHNLGQKVSLNSASGETLSLLQTDQLGSANGDQPGYDYFTDKRTISTDEPFTAAFSIGVEGRELSETTLRMTGGKPRKIYTALSPWARTTRSGSAPEELRGLMPTLLVRQKDECWSKPFAVVIETAPPGKSTVRSIHETDNLGENLVALRVESLIGNTQRTDTILSDADEQNVHTFEGVGFQGAYGCITHMDGELHSLYLGSGKQIVSEGIRLTAISNQSAAALRVYSDSIELSSQSDVEVALPLAIGDRLLTSLQSSQISFARNDTTIQFRITSGNTFLRFASFT